MKLKTLQILSVTTLALLNPIYAQAMCVENCEAQAARPAIIDYGSFNQAQAGQMNFRENSHNMGDVKNSVLGDMHIQVGHEKIDIRTESNSNNNQIDTSINSTIILGDMNN
ncbi:MAG: hypothetical protein ABH859_07210 [Pseudomonadota bacterium]